MKMAGSIGVDLLHHECELDEDIWPGVWQELAKPRNGTDGGDAMTARSTP